MLCVGHKPLYVFIIIENIITGDIKFNMPYIRIIIIRFLTPLHINTFKNEKIFFIVTLNDDKKKLLLL